MGTKVVMKNKKIAYWSGGERAATSLTYEQWAAQWDKKEKRVAKAIIAREADKYAPRKK